MCRSHRRVDVAVPVLRPNAPCAAAKKKAKGKIHDSRGCLSSSRDDAKKGVGVGTDSTEPENAVQQHFLESRQRNRTMTCVGRRCSNEFCSLGVTSGLTYNIQCDICIETF